MSTQASEETILVQALRLASDQRQAFVEAQTRGNPALRQRMESLLGSYDSGAFLEEAADPTLRGNVAERLPGEKVGDWIGRYKLLEQIGEGGCGVVYVAAQEEPVKRRVALKIVKLGMDTKSVVARFEAERQALALMDHPSIAKVFDAGATESGRPYFVMELVRGMKITDYCDEAKLSIPARLGLFIQVCQAIQHAHQKGIIHRDIKPSNVLVTVNDGVAVPKVIDFGIAKAINGQRLTDQTIYTAFEQFVGTPAYMSPEQAVLTSVDIDTRSDIYALGVLLYELLTGKTPFDSKELLAIGLDEMRRTIRERDPDRPSTRLSTMAEKQLSTTAQRRGIAAPKLASELRGDLDWIVMKCLEKDRGRRYETANGLARDIERHLNNELVAARPPNNLYRFQKMVRRNKLAFTAGAAVAVALVLGSGLSTWMYLQERAAKREQVRLRELAEANEQKARFQAIHSRATEWRTELFFHMSNHAYADADSVLTNLLSKAEASQADYAPVLEVRAAYLGRRGRLGEAAADYARLIDFEPKEVVNYYRLAALLLVNGDVTDYRPVAGLMLAKFGAITDPGVADKVCKTCCLLPPPESDLAKLGQLAETALTVKDTEWGNNSPWFHLLQGLFEYRRGDYQAALDWTGKTLSEPLRFSDNMRFASAYMVAAMAHCRLNQKPEARAALAEGVVLAETKLPKLNSGDLGSMWENVLHARILMREAKALIEGESQAAAKTK